MNYLFASVLQIPHKRLLDTIELRKLNVNSLSGALKILCTFCKILSTFDTSRGNSEGTLVNDGCEYINGSAATESDLELLIDAFQTVDRGIEAANLVIPNFELLLQVCNFAQKGVTLGGVLYLQLILERSMRL